MTFRYSSSGNFNGLRKIGGQVEKLLFAQEARAATYLTKRILELTPVWEGDTIANFLWSSGTPEYRHIQPVAIPDDPGHTNKMPLGSEPRRPVNEAPVWDSLIKALASKKLVDLYLTNSSDSAVDLEYGLLPTPYNSRSRGIVRVALKELAGRLRDE